MVTVTVKISEKGPIALVNFIHMYCFFKHIHYFRKIQVRRNEQMQQRIKVVKEE